MKRLFQAVAAVSFGLVLGVLWARLRILIAEDSLSTLTAQAFALDLSTELLQVLSGFGALAVSAFALVGLGCVPKTRRSTDREASAELVARTLQTVPEIHREENATTSDAMPDKTAESNGRDLHPIERHVHECINRQLDALEPGLSEHVGRDGTRGVELAIPLGVIDILAKNRVGDLVVVKIAVNDKPEDLVSNMLAQIAWVRQHLAGTRPVRGILVALTVPEDLRLAISEVPAIQIREFELQANLRRQASPQVTPTVTMPHEAMGPTTVSLVS